MEPARIFRTIINDHRLSTLLLAAIALTLVLLALEVPRQRRPTGEPIMTIEEGGLFEALEYEPSPVSLQRELAAAIRGPRLMPDRPGMHDLPGVPAFPGAQRVDNRTVFAGFVDQADYRTLEPPSAAAMFYYDQLTEAGWRVERLQPLDSGGHGWWALFRSKDNIEVIAIYATTRWLDLPPGGDRNVTHISASRTNLPAEEIAVHLETDPRAQSATWIRPRWSAVRTIVQARCRNLPLLPDPGPVDKPIDCKTIKANIRVAEITPSEGGKPGNNMVTVRLEAEVPLALALGPLDKVTMEAVGKAPLEPYYGIPIKE